MRLNTETLEVARSNIREKLKGKTLQSNDEVTTDSFLVEEIKDIIKVRPTYGCRRFTAFYNRKQRLERKRLLIIKSFIEL
jgi:hypothetical protein